MVYGLVYVYWLQSHQYGGMRCTDTSLLLVLQQPEPAGDMHGLYGDCLFLTPTISAMRFCDSSVCIIAISVTCH